MNNDSHKEILDKSLIDRASIEDLVEKDLEELRETLEPGAKTKVLFKRKNLMLTYKTHINKKELEKFMSDKLKVKGDNSFIFWRAAHETGDQNHPYPHTHVVCVFKTAWQCYNTNYFDFPVKNDSPRITQEEFDILANKAKALRNEMMIREEFGNQSAVADLRKLEKQVEEAKLSLEGGDSVIHPNIKGITSAKHLENAKIYLGKEDPENADLKETANMVKGIMACKTKIEALEKYCIAPSYAPGVIAIFQSKEGAKCKSNIHNFRRWQLEVKNICEYESAHDITDNPVDSEGQIGRFENGTWVPATFKAPPKFAKNNRRKLNVLWDPKGNNGKTVFCKEMMIYDPSKYFSVGTMSTSRDMATVIASAFDGGWNGDSIFINLTRACADHKIYDPLEAIRDGMMTSQKYQGKTILWEMKNVWLFMNWMPNLEAVSMDRWQIWGIHPVTGCLYSIPTAEALAILATERDDRTDRLANLPPARFHVIKQQEQ